MKTPKTNKLSPKDKFSGPKLGKVKKSALNVTNKKLSALSNIKNTDQALNILENSKGNVNITVGKKKDKTKPPKEFIESSKEVTQSDSVFSKKKSPKGKKGKGLILNGAVTSDKEAPKKKNLLHKPVDPEHNSSPVKVNVENKKVKLPFKLDDSLNVLTPQKSNKNKNKSPKTNSSPEVLLGIELEKALSPKSEKEKKKLLKKNIPNKDILDDASVEDGISKKKNKRKKRSPKEILQNQNVSEEVVTVNQTPEKGGKEHSKSEDKASAETIGNDVSAEPGSQAKSGKKKRKKRPRKQPMEPELAEFSLFEEINAKNALKALLNVTKSNQKGEKDLFGEDKFIYLQINLLKGSEKSKSVLHVILPHLILPDNPEVCLITPDIKGKRNDPDEAIDFYQDLLRKKGIDYISEIIPIRKLKREYTSFEHRMKLSNRLDAVLVEGRVSKFARIGRRFARTKKCVSNVQLEQEDLKAEFDKALRRVAMFSNGRGLSFSIKCGRVGMSVNDIAENIMTIGKRLVTDKIIIGNQKNIGSVFVKTALSKSFPIYVSLTNPNEVKMPEGKIRKVEEPIEDEISTVLGAKVVVHPSGNVRVKKLKTDLEPDNELPKLKKEPKAEGKKKGVTGKDKSPGSSEEEDSDQDLDSDEDEEEDLDLKLLASSKLGSEDDDDDSEFDGDEDDNDDDDDEDGDDDAASASDDSDAESDVEDQIVAAEREYLEEVRRMQDTIAKKKRDIAKQTQNKPEQNQGKKAQLQKNDKKQDSPNSGSNESRSMKENNQKKKNHKPGLSKPANQQKKADVEGNQQKKSDKLGNPPEGGKKQQNQQNRKRPANNNTSTTEKVNKVGFSAAKKGKFEKSGDGKKGALGKKPFQGGKKLKSN